jgi:N-acetylglucosaminyldiphosphoundecaprenol N-acetyl-beta-D-mannosaminyltransferase
VAEARLHVAGLPFIDADIDAATAHILKDIAGGTSRVYVFVNAHSATLRRREPDYATLLEDDLVVPLADGAPLAAYARLTGHRNVRRAPGPDVLLALGGIAAQEQLSIYLLGGMPGTVDRLAEVMQRRFPGLRIAGAHTPPIGQWSPTETEQLVAAIADSAPDLICLGVSAPQQEIWARANVQKIGHPVLCVGAAFDFLSGMKPRAPQWMRSMGLEWLFRLAHEPARLWKRYLVGNVVFLVDLLRYGSRKP